MTFTHDGVVFDLARVFVDVIGVEWRWTGGYSESGEPLLLGSGDRTPVPLPDVYHDHGPLIPLPTKPALTFLADYAASLQDGHTESYEQWARRTAQAAT